MSYVSVVDPFMVIHVPYRCSIGTSFSFTTRMQKCVKVAAKVSKRVNNNPAITTVNNMKSLCVDSVTSNKIKLLISVDLLAIFVFLYLEDQKSGKFYHENFCKVPSTWPRGYCETFSVVSEFHRVSMWRVRRT